MDIRGKRTVKEHTPRKAAVVLKIGTQLLMSKTAGGIELPKATHSEEDLSPDLCCMCELVRAEFCGNHRLSLCDGIPQKGQNL